MIRVFLFAGPIATTSQVVYQASVPNSDPQKRRDYQRDYIRRTWQRHLEHSKEAMRRWRANNPEERSARDRAYKERHRDQVNEGYRRYARNHRDQRLANSRRRRARVSGAGGNFTLAEWRGLLDRYEHRCAYCGVDAPLQADHRVPLCRGGMHDVENILPACGRCNRRKSTMSEVEFRSRLANEGEKRRKMGDEAG